MKYEELKQGSLIKWEANRTFKSWNTFGKVISITEKEVTIVSFDNFEETTISKTGEAVEDEIELCDEHTVSDYIALRIANLNLKKVETELEFKKNIRVIDDRISKLSDLKF